MRDDEVDALLAAMAHSGRRRMLDLVMTNPGMNVAALSSHFEMSRIAVLKHVRVLEDASLLLSRKRGRERHLFFNPIPIQLLHDRWTNQYSAFWAERMVDIKARIEQRLADAEDNKSA